MNNQIYNYRPPYSVLLWSLLYIIVFLISSFFSSQYGFKDISFKTIKSYIIVLSPFIIISISWLYFRKYNKSIITEENWIIIPHRWRKKIYKLNYNQIISLTKFDFAFYIQIRDRESLISIKKSWMNNTKEFESLYNYILKEFEKRECHFMIHWKQETPYNFKTDLWINNIYIAYKNPFSSISDVEEGPFISNLWINNEQYSKDYFSGPLLWDSKFYIYLPYFEGSFFILARINLNTHEMNLIGDEQEIICLDHIENDYIYFYNDSFGENTPKNYNLKDESLYQAFEPNRKGVKMKS